MASVSTLPRPALKTEHDDDAACTAELPGGGLRVSSVNGGSVHLLSDHDDVVARCGETGWHSYLLASDWDEPLCPECLDHLTRELYGFVPEDDDGYTTARRAAAFAEDVAAVAAAADHPAFIECQRTARLLTAFARQRPDDEQAADWAFEAVERATQVAGQIADGATEEDLRPQVDEARGERAAFTLGQLEDAGPMTPDRLTSLDEETIALLQWYAGPWPVRWLFEPAEGDPPRVINLFVGPGGWCTGIRTVLRADVDMIGVDLDPGAVATGRAAGFTRICASVTDLDPENAALQWVTGIILSPPCQAYSPAGLRKGRYAAAIALIVSVIRDVRAAAGFLFHMDADGNDLGAVRRSGESWEEIREPLAELEDPRAGLMAEVVIWPLAMLARYGQVEWVVVEQSSALPQEIEGALVEEFLQAGWAKVEAETRDAVTYGAASHRKRRFMAAYRTRTPFVDATPAAPFPTTTFAGCVGWKPGRLVNTRGVRGINPATGKPKGGGNFSADKPSTCITATAYGWKDQETGERIGQANIGRLVGFPGDYPWRHVGRGEGIRTKAQQAADAVCPMVAAAVIARVLGITGWEGRTRAYVQHLYSSAVPAARQATDLPAPRCDGPAHEDVPRREEPPAARVRGLSATVRSGGRSTVGQTT